MVSTIRFSTRACARPRLPSGSRTKSCRRARSADAVSEETPMNFKDRQVVVTGGTGALGIAVVGALLNAGATCHIPYRSEDEAKRFPHREHKAVSLVALGDLADESAVNGFYGDFTNLWASI